MPCRARLEVRRFRHLRRAMSSLLRWQPAAALQPARESRAPTPPSSSSDFACPVAVAVVSASAPVTVSDDQAALLVRRTQAFPLMICQWEPQVLAHTALIVWQANTDSGEHRSFKSDFEDGVAAPWTVRARKRAIILL